MVPATSGMTDKRLSFYTRVLAGWVRDRGASILVVGGGATDRSVLLKLGFQNAVISNLDSPTDTRPFAPYDWRILDAENLQCRDEEYDYVIVHAALHHCASPHRALLEMYRVARHALILFESRDSLVMRIVEALGLTETYETSAVYYNRCECGGVRNTHLPNFVYRWTEREIEKTISSFAPHARHRIQYRYGNDVADTPRMAQNRLKGLVAQLAAPGYWGFAKLFPRQQNLFACKVQKPKIPDDLNPWLMVDGTGALKFNREWAQKVFRPSPSGQEAEERNVTGLA